MDYTLKNHLENKPKDVTIAQPIFRIKLLHTLENFSKMKNFSLEIQYSNFLSIMGLMQMITFDRDMMILT